jgi:hypothetical protein
VNISQLKLRSEKFDNNNNNKETLYLCIYLFEVSVLFCMFFPCNSMKIGTSRHKFVVWLPRPKLRILVATPLNPGYPDFDIYGCSVLLQ